MKRQHRALLGCNKKSATDHYLSHGQRLAETTKALGYLGHWTLVAWLDELHPERTKRVLGKAFFQSEFGLSISFIDQFVQPSNREEAAFLRELSASMEASVGTTEEHDIRI